MPIESESLANLRQTTSKLLLTLLWLHVPISIVIGLLRAEAWLFPCMIIVAMAAAASASWWTAGNGPSTRLIIGVAVVGDVSVVVFQMAGHPWQLDLHMYFFAALASLMAYCDYRPILAGAIAVVLHHLVLNFVLPAAIYPGGADFLRFVLHAVILFLEAGVLIALAHKLGQLFETAARKTAEAEAAQAAEARATSERSEAEQRSKHD